MTKTVRKPTPEQKRMRACVAKFQKYVATYDTQAQYDTYLEKTYLDDMLYGIGLSLMELKPTDYTAAGGYERFKQYLREHLK
jgi:hypothetical protein